MRFNKDNYIKAKAIPVEEDYFGCKIIDHYRYLENLESLEVMSWLRFQANHSRKSLDHLPYRGWLLEKMQEIDIKQAAQISLLTISENNSLFYIKTLAGEDVGKLYYKNKIDAEEIMLFDPYLYSNNGEKYTINSLSPSYDGLKVAFEIAQNGSESNLLLIYNITNKTLYPERIDCCWFASPSWLPDNNSFIFNRLNSHNVHSNERALNSKCYLHKLGTDSADDIDFFSIEKYPDLDINPSDIPFVNYNKDCQYIFVHLATVDSRLHILYAPTSSFNNLFIEWTTLFVAADEVYNYQINSKGYIYIYTPKNAPNFQILRCHIDNPNIKNAEIIVSEKSDAIISSFCLTSEGMYYTLSQNGVSEKIYFYSTTNSVCKELNLPTSAGSITLTTKGSEYPDLWIIISGWTGSNRYKLNENRNFTIENLSHSGSLPEFDDLIIEELMVSSHDKVKVPLSLIYRKGIKKDSTNPVLFLGYGAYGISMTPFFNPNLLLWTQLGGIFAVPHVRGGRELGDLWYKAGYKDTKPNTWKDLISCAEFMIHEKYTSKGKIAAQGGSAGGILVGRAMTERPDLFAVAIIKNGCLNPLRFENTPNGPVNIPEFGSSLDPAECKSLIEMDAYLHLEKGINYPATLITSGMNDPSVIVWQPAKFAAKLQAYNASNKPILFYIDYEVGHGVGNTKTKQFESLADSLSFAFNYTQTS